MKTYKVVKGDSTLNLKTIVVQYPELDSNWFCLVEILEDTASPEPAIFSKVASRRADNSAFDVFLSPIETELPQFKEGHTYIWQITMSNGTLTPQYKNTAIFKLEIKYRGGNL